MEPKAVVADAALRSVESAIAEALRSGADEEDFYRVVNTSTSKVHGRKKTVGNDHSDKKSPYLANRETRFVIFFFTVLILSIVNSMCFREKQFLQQITVEYEDDLSRDDFTIETAISKYNMGAIAQFLHNIPVNGLPINKTENPCPLDEFFHDGCEARNGGTVCIFPGAILKRVRPGLYDAEVNAFKLLNDTRLFPELYYEDSKCQTILQENVNPLGKRKQEWCANYTYYEDFYKSAFKIFAANNIIPHDLNTCCNTIVYGDNIHIIDFGRYFLNQPPEQVRLENEELLKRILEDVVTSIEASKKSGGRCIDTKRRR